MNDDIAVGAAALAARNAAQFAKSLLAASATQAASLPGSPRHRGATASIHRLSRELTSIEGVPPAIGAFCVAQVSIQVIRSLCRQLGIEAAPYLATVEIHLANDMTSFDWLNESGVGREEDPST
jgi:hypothetical protein